MARQPAGLIITVLASAVFPVNNSSGLEADNTHLEVGTGPTSNGPNVYLQVNSMGHFSNQLSTKAWHRPFKAGVL